LPRGTSARDGNDRVRDRTSWMTPMNTG